ncbi:MAG: hypothetical protein KDD61_04040 [Bdellovibrionales bacterium]|nr:hypothetical protein [Bdellovibrionales bacterium]
MKAYFLGVVTPLFLLLGLGHQSQAKSLEIQLEPYIGYGPFAVTESGTADSQLGPILGGFGGLLWGDWYFALDYHTGGHYKLDKLTMELAHTLFGGGIGYISSNWHLWIGYYPSNKLEEFQQFLEYQGQGYKISVGWKFKSKLAISLNHVINDWNDKRSTVGGTETGSAEGAQTYFSVSAPITIF